jgi:hypothetical protein
MSTAADRLPHRVNHVRGIDIPHCPSRCYQKSNDVLIKKETEGRRARCNELRRPIKLLPSSERPSYYGSSFVVENHFDVVPDAVGFKGRQLSNERWTRTVIWEGENIDY